MSTPPLFVGIDLGTTNSAAAVFDGEQVTLVRNAQGSFLTPSVIRIDARGTPTVGAKAQRALESDPANTSAEFKRLMGTATPIEFKSARCSRLPQELAAEVLRSLRADIKEQFGVAPERVVISVPALFELPQCAATSEAARLAGFEKCELIQEPIASALASGWKAKDSAGHWLVYDLGGGTFDASLLEEQDGFLRVVGHDGDNFLGGRDFDWALVDYALAQLKAQHGVAMSRSDAGAKGVVRKLKQAAEEAKIELTRQPSTTISIPELTEGVDFELEVDRPLLERLCTPLVERSIMVCQRLLERHRVEPSSLQRVVMVGGPTVMPFLRRLVENALHAPFGESLDPMTLVAQGAALYAAMTNLDGRPAAAPRAAVTRLWLNYPAMTSDLTPHVVGRVVEQVGQATVASVRLVRQEGGWQSAEAKLDAEAAFALAVDLLPHRLNTFQLQARDAGGQSVDVEPSIIRMVHGLTISDPPLSRSVGVARADDTVQVYFQRGEPLPARRTFTHKTVETVARGAGESVLKVPIVQGEFARAHLCRVIGALDIQGKDLKNSLPAGSDVQVTLELDRSGRLAARALVPSLGQVFEHVASLLVPDASVDTLSATLQSHRNRLKNARWAPVKEGLGDVVEKVMRMELLLDEADRDLKAATGGDADAGQKAQRNLQEIDALLEDIEMVGRWSELDTDARDQSVTATRWVSLYGSDVEKHLLEEALEAVEQARKNRRPLELERELRVVRDLGNAAFNRHPEALRLHFEWVASRADQARDLPRARSLVKAGEAALARNQTDKLNSIIDQLHQLLPPDAARRRLGHHSGLQ